MMFLGFAGFLALCLPALAISTRRRDAERPGLHSQAERGNDQKQGCAFRHTSGLAKLAALWLCCWVLFAHPVLAATIKATPDRDPVRVDETFNLVFSTAEDVDDDPDFSPLADDFDIVSQNQGSQTSIINGKISQRQEWTLTLSPKRAGRLTIPPIAFGSDRSPAASVTVVDGGAAAPPGGDDHAELKLEVEASPKDPYVQAQVIYTVRILLRVNVVGADLSEPALPDALVEKLGEDRRYNTTRNGWEYTVIERKYAIFPQKSGLLRLDPVQLTAQVEVGGRSFFSRSTRAMRVKSEAIDLKVRPQPTAFTGSHWLPAAELTLEESWTQDPPQAKAGEPITRTLTVRGQGATLGLLPELGADAALDPSIKVYPDQPALHEDKLPTTGISASRQEKAALIPGKPGQFKLKAVEIPWWNTKTDRMEIARIAERTLPVTGEATAAAAQPAPPPAPAVGEAVAPVAAPAGNYAAAGAAIWFWLALLFGVGWLGTGLAWWLSRRARPTQPIRLPPADSVPKEQPARRAVQQACERNDAAAARLALLDWARARWPEMRLVSLAEVADLAEAPLAAEIGRLNRSLYGQNAAEWQGEGLWAAVASVGAQPAGKASEAGLEPLYR